MLEGKANTNFEKTRINDCYFTKPSGAVVMRWTLCIAYLAVRKGVDGEGKAILILVLPDGPSMLRQGARD